MKSRILIGAILVVAACLWLAVSIDETTISTLPEPVARRELQSVFGDLCDGLDIRGAVLVQEESNPTARFYRLTGGAEKMSQLISFPPVRGFKTGTKPTPVGWGPVRLPKALAWWRPDLLQSPAAIHLSKETGDRFDEIELFVAAGTGEAYVKVITGRRFGDGGVSKLDDTSTAPR